MPLASSQGNSPFLAQLSKKLPATSAEWQTFINALQAWNRSLTTIQWRAPTLQNSWVYFGSPHEPPGYYKDATGRVWIRGLVKSGTLGSPIFTLPAGYEPPYSIVQVGISDDLLCEIDISQAGAVTVGSGGNNTWVSLSGISFSTQ